MTNKIKQLEMKIKNLAFPKKKTLKNKIRRRSRWIKTEEGYNTLEYSNKAKNQKIRVHYYRSRPNKLFVIHVDFNKPTSETFKTIGKSSGYNNLYEASIFMEDYIKRH